jgi:hypothetical protein
VHQERKVWQLYNIAFRPTYAGNQG